MKKKYLGRAASLFLSSAMLLSLAGCSKSEPDAATAGNAASTTADTSADPTTAEGTGIAHNEQGYPDLQGETFTIWFAMTGNNAQATDNMGDYTVIKDLEEKFNCKFEFMSPPIGQEADNFAVLMASDKLPDMIFTGGIDNYYPGGVEMAYADGLLYDYTADINETTTPNFYKLVMQDPFLNKAAVDDQGRVIRLGAKIAGSEDADLTYSGPLIRKDYLEQTGLPVPTTIDDWTAMFQAMKDDGVTYPFGLDKDCYKNANVFSAAFGIDDDGYYIKEDGTVGFGPYEPAYKDYLTLLHSWYEAGYINPDFSTITNDDLMSMMADGKVGSTENHLWNYGNKYYVTTESKDPSKALVPAQYPVLKDGDTLLGLRSSGRSLGDFKYITADAKNPQACIALLDALYLEDIDRMLANGAEGVGYEMKDGVPVLIPLPENPSKDVLLGQVPQQWHTKEDTDFNYIITYKYNLGAQAEALKLWKEVGTENMISNFLLFNAEESDLMSSYKADITTFVEESTLKFITGVESLDNFDEYITQLESLHIQDMIQAYQNATDRYNSR